MNECLQKLQTKLDTAHLNYELLTHPVGYTAQHEAAAAHVPGRSYAKSVIVFANDKPAQLVLPAPYEVDLDAVKRRLGAEDIRLVKEDMLLSLFPDSEPGAMPPVPGEAGVPIYLDRALTDTDTIVFDAGSHTDAVRMATKDYLELVNAPIFDFGIEPRRRPTARPSERRPELLQSTSRRSQQVWLVRSGAIVVLSALGVIALGWLARRSFGKQLLAFVAGNVTGAVALALTDSRSGTRRRALVRDKSRKYRRLTMRRARGIATRAGDAVKGRLHGWGHRNGSEPSLGSNGSRI